MFNGHEDRALYHDTLHEALKFFEEDLSSNFGLIAVLVIVALEITKRAQHCVLPPFTCFYVFQNRASLLAFQPRSQGSLLPALRSAP